MHVVTHDVLKKEWAKKLMVGPDQVMGIEPDRTTLVEGIDTNGIKFHVQQILCCHLHSLIINPNLNIAFCPFFLTN